MNHPKRSIPMKPVIPLISASLMMLSGSQAIGGEFAADSYHDSNCTRCHDTGVYTREDRRVRSYPQLQAQVARCDAMLETKLFPDDLAALVDYLDDSYYRFGK